MSWWLTQAGRARSERVNIADLQENADWLKGVKWTMSNDLYLSANFEITVDGANVPLKITYPAFFPDVPPQIYPIGEVRLSRHQYGTGGELCLEIRPDNWEPEMTGAMMIESAHRLLTSEQSEDGEREEVPDAHRTTIAQDVRGEHFRLIITGEDQKRLLALPELSATELELEEIYQAQRWIARPSRIGSTENPLWSYSLKPLKPIKRSGYIVRLSSDLISSVPSSRDGLMEMAKNLGLDNLTVFISDVSTERPILFVAEGTSLLLSLLSGEDRKDALKYKTIDLPPAVQRQSSEYEALAEKMVALVGCGSVGSKVAASLSRAGVGSFVLVDGDILYPGNIVRNDLDQRSIGLNKPDAVKARIQEINPFSEVSVRRVLMGGQESSASTEAALQSIAKCDVIIDATADATIFNLCAAVARSQCKPMIWGEVFAGGVGGIVARARPNIDPIPLLARRQLAAWCADKGVPWDGMESEAYELSRDDAPPLVADDAEVTIIAAHITRLVIDILVREATIFPHSAYAVGLQQEWIFSAPFDTFPINLEAGGEWQQPASEETSAELISLMGELFPNTSGVMDES
ncbi:MAG: ThiF family adenylyltransferase [Candidatus Thiodiazotropha sp.]